MQLGKILAKVSWLNPHHQRFVLVYKIHPAVEPILRMWGVGELHLEIIDYVRQCEAHHCVGKTVVGKGFWI